MNTTSSFVEVRLLSPLACGLWILTVPFSGGTAGLVLANRLSESGKQNVLVLEAGPVPSVVAAYETPGGNQFLAGMSSNSIWICVS